MEARQKTVIRLGTAELECPVYALAPMVGQCDRPFRELCRKYGTRLCYSEMLKAEEIVSNERYLLDALGSFEKGKPLLVQVCTRNADAFAAAAVVVRGDGGGVVVGVW